MDTSHLKTYSIWARVALNEAVKQRMYYYALDDDGRKEFSDQAELVRNRPMTQQEIAQRRELYHRVQRQGADLFAEEMAFTWFNRFAAIRFMELHDYLPGHIRMFSAPDGSFNPECLHEATALDLPGLDRMHAALLIQQSDEETLYREIIAAQCNELAEFMPHVFNTINSADSLMLPNNLLRADDTNVLFRLVNDIPESDWDDIEALGWMYQFYNSEPHDEFYKSKRKASAHDLAPATQLFTPDWIVKYMVENSLGRLWMLNHPESALRKQMEYYIEPDAEHEDFIRIASPEEITFCDPACGSAHILVYAFDLLYRMYEEAGYLGSDIPSLILQKNLTGMEIDRRAAQIASMVLSIHAREYDRRFFKRNVTPRIHVLENIELDAAELPAECDLAKREDLLESLAHLGEIGSLLFPVESDIAVVQDAASQSAEAANNLFGQSAAANLKRAEDTCELLSQRFTCVVANPPYLGSSKFNPFMSKWMKKQYPDSYKDLCTAFIERGFSLAEQRGYSSMVTMQSWMFLGSFEKMRNAIIDSKSIVAMAHLGPRAFDAINGEVVNVTVASIMNCNSDLRGSYIRLVDINNSEDKRTALLEAIQNPSCGWFYRVDAATFHDIPGSPIAYHASRQLHCNFLSQPLLAQTALLVQGLKCGDTERFVRIWSEVSANSILDEKNCPMNKKWHFLLDGGDYRKWYGNISDVVNWDQSGKEIKNNKDSNGRPRARVQNERYYHQDNCLTWSALTSGPISIRLCIGNSICGGAGYYFIPKKPHELLYLLALSNSSAFMTIKTAISETMNNEVGDLKRIPSIISEEPCMRVSHLSELNIEIAKTDWDSQETSWDFKHHPLV